MSDKFKDKFRLDRQTMALRVAKEFQDGDYVNLGIGIPVLASNYVPAGREVVFHSENGVMGFGEVHTAGEGDPDFVNAGGQAVTIIPGTCFFDHHESFSIVRGRHLDISVMGGLQVSEKGDLANWLVPERQIGTIGGAMDLAIGAKQTFVMMEHLTRTGESKLVAECSYPLTGLACVGRIYTDLAVIDVTRGQLRLVELIDGLALDELVKLSRVPIAPPLHGDRQ